MKNEMYSRGGRYSGTVRTNRASNVPSESPSESARRLKRSREEDGDEAECAGDSPKKQKITQLRGLVNCTNACFSNATLQILAAAFTQAQIAQLSGNSAVYEYNAEDVTRRHLEGKSVETAIKKLDHAIAVSSPPKLSPYMGAVLKELHCDKAGAANPVLLQQVFAFGSEKESRRKFNGLTQEDASEYLNDLLPAICAEHGFVNEEFEFKLQNSVGCTNAGCSYRNVLGIYPSVLMQGNIPEAQATPRVKANNDPTPSTTVEAVIRTLFSEDKCDGSACEKCGAKDTLVRQSRIVQYPDHLLVSINRSKVQQSGVRGGGSRRGNAVAEKDTTQVDLNLGDIRVGDDDHVYRITAMIKHRGADANHGHYTALRKIDDGKWAFLNDACVKSVGERHLRDGVKGYSSILLLQRQPKMSSAELTGRDLES